MSVTEKTIPTLQSLQGYDWRPARLADAEAIYELYLARDAHDRVDAQETVGSIRLEFQDSWMGDLETDTVVVITDEGQVAAVGLIFVDPEPLKKRRAFLDLEVHPRHRGIGLRERILTWGERRSRIILEGMDSDLPGEIRVGSEDRFQDRIALYEAHGFQPNRYFYRMRRDLRSPIPDRPVPPGLTLRTYSEDLNRPLMAAFNEAFSDHWNFEPISEEDWDMWVINGEDFRPDLTYLVMDGDEIAGFSVNGVHPEKNRRNGIEEGWIHQLGTRLPWRKRGVASALLRASMNAFQSEGLDYATLGVDTQNPTGALNLYVDLGFEPVRRFISCVKKL
jgi:ribosomal protein S18 acetylase RimI-like enzyme